MAAIPNTDNHSRPRLASLDVLRGVAICGILLMNIFSMGGTTRYPLNHFPPRWDAEWISWGIQTLFVQGAMRGLFTLLFGASMVLMLRRAEGPGAQVAPLDAWVRRSLALMTLGVVQFALFLWPGEILWNYGLTGLFLLAFRTARPRTLLTVAAALIALQGANATHWTFQQAAEYQQGTNAAMAAAEGAPVSTEQRAAMRALQAERAVIHPTPAAKARVVDERTHVGSLLRWSAIYWIDQNIGLTGWMNVAESLSFMLIGMALFRTGVLTGEAPVATYRTMMLAGYGGGLALRGLEVWMLVRTGLDMGAPTISPAAWAWNEALFEPARLLVTLGHAGLVLTLLRAGALGAAGTLRALGRMTLTVYCLQSIITSVLFYGLGLLGRFDLPTLWLIAVGIWFLTAAFCRWWFSRNDMGPAEKLLRRIAYGPQAEAIRERSGAVAA